MATHGILGDTVRTQIVHLNADGTTGTGTAEVLNANRPDGETFDVTIDSQGDGIYVASVETKYNDPAGEWFLLIRIGSRYYEETFDMDGAYTKNRTI